MQHKPYITKISYCCEAVCDKDFNEKGYIVKDYEIIRVKSGSIKVTSGKNVFPVYENQIIILTPGSFCALNNNNRKAEVFLCSFSGRIEYENMKAPLLVRSDGFTEKLIEALLKRSEAEEEKQTVISLLLTELIIAGLSDAISLINEEEHYSRSSKTYYDIYTYMEANFHRHLSLEEIAKETCISVSVLKSTVFKHTGSGVIRLFNIIKLLNMLRLVKEGADLKSAAKSAGFEDMRYLRKLFRKEFDMNPENYIDGE